MAQLKVMKVLILEDDPVLSNEIKEFLDAKGMECDTAFDGEIFFKAVRSKPYDIFVLDINVPKINGLEVCRQIRETERQTPIMMITAYGQIDDKLEAFNLGADDYLVKPFHLQELHARLQALYRRRGIPQTLQTLVKVSDLTINLDEKSVKRDGVNIVLTPKEFKLLLMLAEANGRVLSKQHIADHLWDYNIETSPNTIEVYINFLRNKVDKNFKSKLIHTKVGFGYYLKDMEHDD